MMVKKLCPSLLSGAIVRGAARRGGIDLKSVRQGIEDRATLNRTSEGKAECGITSGTARDVVGDKIADVGRKEV